jgi:formate hydrogenlyase subunit 6/NADH:ubiquinone oxidoreductase subunit I
LFFKIIDKESIVDLYAGLAAEYDEVTGPKTSPKDPRYVKFGKIRDASQLRLDYKTSIVPPKKYFLAADERLMRYDRTTGEVYDTEPPLQTRALIGVHPCDINAILMLDDIFLNEFEDPYYKVYRENTFIVGVSCMPSPTCTCNSFGADEVHRGFDLFLSDLGDRWFVSVRSVKAAAIVDRYLDAREVTADDTRAFQERTKRFKKALPKRMDLDQLPLLYDAKYDYPLWEDIGKDCLSCGACSVVCPCCYCFDVRDTLSADGRVGKRHRVWDSCLASEFAEVAHNHNFRPKAADRVRYRFYHKFVGNFTRNGKMLCVGCGRCTTACKAFIDPQRIVKALESEDTPASAGTRKGGGAQ